MRHMRVHVLDLAIPNSPFYHDKKMFANKNTMPGPSNTKQTATDLKAELVVMEEEEAAKVKRKQEHEEKKKKLAELTEAKKVEEAVMAAAEVVWKAMASTKKVGKWQAKGPVEDECHNPYQPPHFHGFFLDS